MAGFVDLVFRLWSPIYDAAVFQRPFYRRVHARVVRRLAGVTATRAIDLGCGTAQLTVDVVRAFPAALVVGVDLSAHMLRAARQRLGADAPPLVRADVYALPFAAGSLDLVTSSISYHWYREPARALAEVARVLRPGGRLLLATMRGWPRSFDVGPARWASDDETRAELARAGFEVVASEHVFPLVTLHEARRR